MTRAMMMAGVVWVAGGLAVAGVARGADEQAYVLKYVRAVTVGQKTAHEVKSTVTIQNTPVGNGLSVEQMEKIAQPIKVTLKGKFVREVMEISGKGEPTKMKLTFESLTDSSTGKEMAVVEGGTQVVMTLAEGSDPVVEAVDGQTKLTANAKGLIRQAVNARQGMGLDELLGASTARKVGDAWRLDKGVLMKSLPASDRPADAENVDGTAKLLRVETVGGQKCVVVESVVVVKDVRAGGNFMKGKVTGSGMAVTQTIPVPLDEGSIEVGGGRESKMTMKVEYPANAPLQRLDVTATDKREETIVSVK
jgi:hypothetical protein